MSSLGPLQISYYFIGSKDTASTLTALFAGNTSTAFTLGREMGQLELEVTYTPKVGESNRYLVIRVERGQESDNLFQITKTEDASLGDEYVVSRPYDIIFPNESGTVGGTTYKGDISIPIAHKWGRISVKESGSSNFGTCSVKAILTSRQ